MDKYLKRIKRNEVEHDKATELYTHTRFYANILTYEKTFSPVVEQKVNDLEQKGDDLEQKVDVVEQEVDDLEQEDDDGEDDMDFFRKGEDTTDLLQNDDHGFENNYMNPLVDGFPIERMAEVVVKLPIIPNEWLVDSIPNCKQEPKKDGGSKPPHKSKVIYGGRAYKVRKEDRRKYILVKGIKTYLGEIRGQYKYKKE